MSMNAAQKKLLIILALFFVPLAIAMVWYSLLPANYQPDSTTNNGNLVLPVYPLQAFEQTDKDGQPYTLKNLEMKWTLVHLIGDNCDEACSKQLYNTRQIRIALAEDIERVNRLALVSSEQVAADNERMWASHPDLAVVIDASGGVAEQIRSHTAAQAYPAHSIFLIDPLGNLMMQFSPDLDPKLLMKDLEKLLKLSHIG
ncbi:MAG: SCO family protein [Thiolinea sp.]